MRPLEETLDMTCHLKPGKTRTFEVKIDEIMWLNALMPYDVGGVRALSAEECGQVRFSWTAGGSVLAQSSLLATLCPSVVVTDVRPPSGREWAGHLPYRIQERRTTTHSIPLNAGDTVQVVLHNNDSVPFACTMRLVVVRASHLLNDKATS